MKNFKAFEFATELYSRSKSIKLPNYLQDQLLRASSSVALNIAEGSGKRTANDKARFYGIALSSLRECQAIFILEKINDPNLTDLANQLGAILFTLSKINREKDKTTSKKIPADWINFDSGSDSGSDSDSETETETETDADTDT